MMIPLTFSSHAHMVALLAREIMIGNTKHVHLNSGGDERDRQARAQYPALGAVLLLTVSMLTLHWARRGA